MITNSVELGQIGDHDLLERALRAKYGNVTRYGEQFVFFVGNQRVTLSGGEARSSLNEGRLQQVVCEVKQAYSRESIKEAADQFGWLVEEGENENDFVVVRN